MSEAYRGTGVDTEAARRAVALIGDLTAGTGRPEVDGGIGGFAGLYRASEGKLLAAATDGVGTKLEIARMTGRLTTVGIDLVAMCADDVVCTGAEPLFFLDYLAVGKLVPERVAALVEGVVEGCERAGCVLLGGETAEHPGVMDEDRFDMAGFCVGSVDEVDLLGPERVSEGDVVIGLASSGLHSNGFSLVRSALVGRHELDSSPPEIGRSLADELLEPCAIYAKDVLALARAGVVRSAAHITGGGFLENVPRALPERLGVDIERGTWPEHAVFSFVQKESGATDDDMFSTFNMGIGMVLIVAPDDADQVIERGAPAAAVTAYRIGRVAMGAGVRIS